ncbi:acyl-CoA dehydrogenase family member 9, mitochondrial [Copidosoma floridanum]|uniref:acyl-CoA dehydrogenase family member 9, mitochondrial n=1 Tax=Copidosoma floridanum TaxID=29053 RepID=UPI0006C94C75|nr:acyl-CoA dehydrogenase family member 9, mitochondrial [Copidosoma floridanum]
MLISRFVTRRAKNAYFHQVPRCLATQAKPKSEVMDFKKQRLPAAQPKKPKREPFAKNLFLGKFDYEFLAYPEPQRWDRWNEFQEWIMPLKEYMNTVNQQEFESSNKIPPHVLQSLREMGIFGARIHEDYKGQNLLQSEFMQVLETVGKIPALGFFLLKQGVPAIDIFNKYGTVEQKFQYLPKIATGQSLASVALHEATTGPMASDMETTAILDLNEEYWLLDGEKIFVPNTDLADVFIVFGHAMHSGSLEKRPEIVSSFIIERDTEGLTVIDSPMETLGLKGFNCSKIILKNVKIPKSNMLGQVGDGARQIVDMFTNSRHFVAALMIPLLKNHVNLLTNYCLHKKYFEKPLHDATFAQSAITELNYTIYAIESVLYLTTAMMDLYEDQDVHLESALVEQFAVQEALKALHESMWLVGPSVCSTIMPYQQILRDAFTLANFETQLHDTKIYSGLLGLTYYGQECVEAIRKIRNPLMYPKFLYQRLFKNNLINLKLHEYLHLSLRDCTNFADGSIYILKTQTEQLLVRYGIESSEQHRDLQRLSDIVSYIYSLVGVLGRASRSYCIGNRFSEIEIIISRLLAFRYHQRIKTLSEDLNNGKFINGDHASQELSLKNFENKAYYMSHPLQRNY